MNHRTYMLKHDDENEAGAGCREIMIDEDGVVMVVQNSTRSAMTINIILFFLCHPLNELEVTTAH